VTEGDRFARALRRAVEGIWEVSDTLAARLEAHYELMLRWNRRMKLTSVTGLEEAVVRHYAESIFLAANLPAGACTVVDVGSGAGFPGFPLALCRPECSVTLVESVGKKAAFLEEACRGVANVRVAAVRAESLEARFDWLVSRAVAWREIPKLAGRFAVLVGGDDAAVLGGRKVRLPWGERRWLVMGEYCAEPALPDGSHPG